MTNETIFAPASGTGRSAVAVIRISGPDAATALERLTGRCLPARVATLVTIRDPRTATPLDRGLALWFPAPHSFTGEDSAEFQVHGSRAVVASILDALGSIAGCRPAEPGAFTRRAFLNGKLDLAAVEGLADLIDAQTEAQRKQALHQLDGSLGRWAEQLRASLLEALALTESAIDFADEGDISESALREAAAIATDIAARVRAELDRPQSAERIREGFVVTLAGPPNVGKSTLLNALARRDVAIVSPHAGTTRDPIAVDLDLGGYAVVVIDTAGLRETIDPIEREGVARARAKAEAADLVLWLQDGREAPAVPDENGFARIWTIKTKLDLGGLDRQNFDFEVSAHTGEGLDRLIDRLRLVVAHDSIGGETALVSRLRHRQALEDADARLRQIAAHSEDAELAAEDLRAAASALGQITGRIDVEEVLGAIFSRFCIGK